MIRELDESADLQNRSGGLTEIELQSIRLVDQVFALCEPSGGLTGPDQELTTASVKQANATTSLPDSSDRSTIATEAIPRSRILTKSGEEAWAFIRRLRRRVWVKLDLDVDTGNTRAQIFSENKENARKGVGLPERWYQEAAAQTSEATEEGMANQFVSLLGAVDPEWDINWDHWDEVFGFMNNEINFAAQEEEGTRES